MAKFEPMPKNPFFFLRFPSFFACLLFLPFALQLREGLNQDVLKYTNQFRRSRGLSPLVMNEELNELARKHSEDMARGRGHIGHDGYDKREAKVRKIFKPFYGMAENVAYGARSGKEVVTMWKNSSGHRRNMLGDYRYIGVGTARDRRGMIYYTQIFVR